MAFVTSYCARERKRIDSIVGQSGENPVVLGKTILQHLELSSSERGFDRVYEIPPVVLGDSLFISLGAPVLCTEKQRRKVEERSRIFCLSAAIIKLKFCFFC